MSDLGEHRQCLIDPEKVVVRRQESFHRRLYQAYYWPIVFAVSCFALVIVAGLGIRDYHYSDHHNDEPTNAEHILNNEASVSLPLVNYAYAIDTAGPPGGLEYAVFDSNRMCIASPNAKYQFCMTENGNLLLSQHDSTTSTLSPVWWANSGDYKRTGEASWERYATLDPAGILRVEKLESASKSKETQHRQQWSSEATRLCREANTTQLSLRSPTSQALALEDNGQLSIFNSQGEVTCILYPGSDSESRPELYHGVDFSVEEDPTIPVHMPGTKKKKKKKKKIWPKYRNSSHTSLLQLRAMLEKDLAGRNITLNLNITQLETIHNTAIIIPTWHGHLEFVTKFLRSMVRHCVDCNLWQINLVVDTEDIELFNNSMFGEGDDKLSYWLPGLRLLEFEKLEFKHYAADVDVPAEVSKISGKFMIQNFKKAYGCFATGKQYCSLLDSEGMVIRATWYSDVVQEFRNAPIVLHNSDARNDHVRFITPLTEVLDIPDLHKAGWLMEYYGWFFDASVYDAVLTIIAKKHPQINTLPEKIFFELAYWAYIWADKGPVPGPKHTFIDAKDFYGERLYNLTWHRYVNKGDAEQQATRRNGNAIIEDLRYWLDRFPTMLFPAAAAFDRHNLRYYKVHPNHFTQNVAFLSSARSVRMCVSQHEPDLYEAAMAGELNLRSF